MAYIELGRHADAVPLLTDALGHLGNGYDRDRGRDKQVQRAVAAGCHREPVWMRTEQGIQLVRAIQGLAVYVGTAAVQHVEHLRQHGLAPAAGLGVRDVLWQHRSSSASY